MPNLQKRSKHAEGENPCFVSAASSGMLAAGACRPPQWVRARTPIRRSPKLNRLHSSAYDRALVDESGMRPAVLPTSEGSLLTQSSERTRHSSDYCEF